MPLPSTHEPRRLRFSRASWFGAEYHLDEGPRRVATLRREGWVGRAAVGRCADPADGVWTFRRRGWPGRSAAIEPARPQSWAIAFEGGWRGGTLSLPEGRRAVWARTRLLPREWAFTEHDGATILIRFRHRHGLFHGWCEVVVEPAALDSPDLNLMMLAGCWLERFVYGRRRAA